MDEKFRVGYRVGGLVHTGLYCDVHGNGASTYKVLYCTVSRQLEMLHARCLIMTLVRALLSQFQLTVFFFVTRR